VDGQTWRTERKKRKCRNQESKGKEQRAKRGDSIKKIPLAEVAECTEKELNI
jgi:hypothetical protein